MQLLLAPPGGLVKPTAPGRPGPDVLGSGGLGKKPGQNVVPPPKRNSCFRSNACLVIGTAKSIRIGPNGEAHKMPAPTEVFTNMPLFDRVSVSPVAPGV